METHDLKYAVEAILFASERPLTPQAILQAFLPDKSDREEASAAPSVAVGDVETALSDLKSDYESAPRGFKLFEIAGGWQLVSDPRYADFLKRFYQDREKRRLSQASLETLSVVAYRQPVTKADIEFIRGVNVDGPLKTLLDKNLVKIAGRKEIPGRPFLYGTTKEFLEHFALSSLKDLPALAEFSEKDIEPHLLPPDLKIGDSSIPAEHDAAAGDGQQQPVGCDNSPSDESVLPSETVSDQIRDNAGKEVQS